MKGLRGVLFYVGLKFRPFCVLLLEKKITCCCVKNHVNMCRVNNIHGGLYMEH